MKLECNWVNVTNYFNNTGKERLREALERGDKVMICVDCIGHTRSEMVEAEYAHWLRDTYGEKLHVDEKTAWGAVYYLSQERGITKNENTTRPDRAMPGERKTMEKEELIDQIGNCGEVCMCGAYMYANVYVDKYVVICPQCGWSFTSKRNTEDSTTE